MVLLTLLGGCGESGSTGSADRLGTPGATLPAVTAIPRSSGSPTGAPIPTDGTEGALGRAAVRAYQAWSQAQVEAFGRSDSDSSQLVASSTGPALSESLATLYRLREAKLVMIGAPRNSPVLKALDPGAKPPTAVIEDCVDVSDWHQADAGSKAIKDPERRLSRYVATVGLRLDGSRWLITDFKREVDRTC
ncbi:hypothetical protein [Kitasatospora camelliae]|uniref:Mce-associated membrane protein n=1 Tax=Kitasatospora camelliae TaxID=3156397 RepID=A0AAU8K4I3_9ACTN